MKNNPKTQSSARRLGLACLVLVAVLTGLILVRTTQAKSPIEPSQPAAAPAFTQANELAAEPATQSIQASSLVTVTASADTSIDSRFPDTNYGSATALGVNLTPSSTLLARSALLYFDLSTALPPDAIIDQARLDLYLSSGTGDSPVNIYATQVITAWTEMSVTWNTQPAVGAVSVVASVDSVAGYKSWDATSLVSAWLNGDNYGLLVARSPGQTSAFDRRFRSREYASDVPRLVITYHQGIDLTVTQASSPKQVGLGERLTYTLSLSNTERVTATGVRLTDTLPVSVTFAWASPGCARAGGTVTCALGDLPGRQGIQVTLAVTAPQMVGFITNTVQLAADQPDPVLANNQASLVTFVQERPFPLTPGGISSYAVANPKLFWSIAPECNASGQVANASALDGTLGRVAIHGSPPRQLRPPPDCNDRNNANSNLLADSGYVYWSSRNGLLRLPTTANPDEPPAPLTSVFSGTSTLAQNSSDIFALLSSNGQLWRVPKSTGNPTLLRNIGGGSSQLAADDENIYWLSGANLRRYNLAASSVVTPAINVSGFYVEGPRTRCQGCPTTRYVFIGHGAQVVRYNGVDSSTSAPIYTSPATSAQVYGLASTDKYLFILEERSDDQTNVVMRLDLASGKVITFQVIEASFQPRMVNRLSTAGKYVVMQGLFEGSSTQSAQSMFPELKPTVVSQMVARLHQEWTMPEYTQVEDNVRVTGASVTQGIQDETNSVLLIQNRRTFVRVFVDSTGPSNVSGVTARLHLLQGGYTVKTLSPINSNADITVHLTPDRNNWNDSFLFELPLSWTTAGALGMEVEVNPYNSPLENNYWDNYLYIGNFSFQPSPRLEAQFVRFGYSWGGVEYWPRVKKDVRQTYWWIRRAYPLASTGGYASDPTPGFRPRGALKVFDDELGGHVNQTSQYCLDIYDQPDEQPYINCCASYYTNSRLAAMRTEHGWPDTLFLYGMISDGLKFPRGQADGTAISSGPVGTPGSNSWDTDGSYADWYGAHEIGHTLGRAHPVKGSSICGHSASDPDYPYAGAHIGPGDGSVEGFDWGKPSYDIPRQVIPDNLWTDVMSYCAYEWISDYTYNCMYEFMMTGNVSSSCGASALLGRMVAPSTNANQAPARPLSGDWLNVSGLIMTNTNTAHIGYLRRLNSVAVMPPRQPGDYSLQLLDAQDSVLADYAFTPYRPQDGAPSQLNFAQVVTFTAGTARVRIVNASQQELGSLAISPNPPTVSAIILQGASDPVTGIVTLTWTASDPDGDPLRFDVLYSRDGGATFDTIHLNIAQTSVSVDTAELGGSTSAVLRVVASDGSQSAQADSAPFTMANKPPEPEILDPDDGIQIHYGQLVNLIGEAFDFQGGDVISSNLVWRNQKGVLGTGTALALTDLPVGVNWITLTATNTLGLAASDTITIVVDDDLDLAGPTLTAGPLQIGWHVAAGSTTPQTATLALGNSGSGIITWTATSNATWLTLSTDSGTAPAHLILTGNPNGIAGGTTVSTQLVVQGTGGVGEPMQTITIPVSLSVGDVWSSPKFEPGGYRIFLPLVLKSS